MLALKPSHDGRASGRHRRRSLQEVAQAAGWKSAEQPGQWVQVERSFRDGSKQSWWAPEVQAGPYGPEKTERAVIATTDPETLPDATTWYLVTNIPVPGSAAAELSALEAASLPDVVRLYGLEAGGLNTAINTSSRSLVGHSIRCEVTRPSGGDFQLVCCAFSFCCYHASHSSSSTTQDAREASESPPSQEPEGAVSSTAPGEKNQQKNSISSLSVLAGGAAGRARVVGALDHAAALLESVVRAAPTSSSPALA